MGYLRVYSKKACPESLSNGFSEYIQRKQDLKVVSNSFSDVYSKKARSESGFQWFRLSVYQRKLGLKVVSNRFLRVYSKKARSESGFQWVLRV